MTKPANCIMQSIISFANGIIYDINRIINRKYSKRYLEEIL